MADDDLDAFFDEVEEAEEEAKKSIVEVEPCAKIEQGKVKSREEEDEDVPPSKKAKVAVAGNAPVVVTVAAAAPTINVSAESMSSLSKPMVVSKVAPISVKNNIPSFTSVGVPSVPIPPTASSTSDPQSNFPKASKNVIKRTAAGKTWEDPTLIEWPKNDFRLFVGNLAKDVHTTQLEEVFRNKYTSFAMGRVIYNKADNKSKGYGFVSFLDPRDAARALREMNDTFLGSRPIKVKRGEWQERDFGNVQKKKKQEKKMKKKLGLS